MRIEVIATDDSLWRTGDDLPTDVRNVLHAALGASAPTPTDPMDCAIHIAAEAAKTTAPRDLAKRFGLMPDLFATTNVWGGNDGVSLVAYAKGAPEAIAELCRLPEERRALLLCRVDEYAKQGIRVLAIAEAVFAPRDGAMPQSQRDIPFGYIGLIGFADPLRATVPAAINECRAAGIRVIMITGDYPTTAAAIAHQAGIGGGILSGDELDILSNETLAERIKTCSVFARIRPQQKLRIVEALKRDGEIVAMTGDGVNDAPAMKAAHIGIAMGLRGTDVAREAASLVLLDDDFASIVATIRLGRRIYGNLCKAIQYIIAVHVPIAGLALLPFPLGLPLILMPVQIALLEMVIDPACSVVFESEIEEADAMKRPPRKSNTPVLTRTTAFWAATQGVITLVIVGLTLFLGGRAGMIENELRSFVFTTLVLTNMGLILVNRSFLPSLADALLRPNRALWILISAVLVVLSAALYWPPLQNLFHFGPLHPDDLFLCIAAGVVVIGLLEFGKRLIRVQTR